MTCLEGANSANYDAFKHRNVLQFDPNICLKNFLRNKETVQRDRTGADPMKIHPDSPKNSEKI